jgi:hypothetical protein
VGEKKEDWGVISKTAIFSLPSIQNREGGARPGGRPAGCFAGGPVLGDGWKLGKNGVEGKGNRPPVLTLC